MIEKESFKRWTATRKMEVVLRLMKGESIDFLSREIGIPASEIETWHQAVFKGVETALKTRVEDPLQAELDLAKKRIGELSMENELLRERSRRNGVFLGGRWK
jgi:transposase